MTDEDKKQYLEFAKKLALDAGDIMLRYFGTTPDQSIKSDDTIVTVADTEINQLVIDRVKDTFSDHAVDGEEASHAANSSYVWVCDPIDGTNPFAMELPVSVFSLALVVDGEPQVGVIYHPFTRKLYHAIKDGNAYVNDDQIYVSKDDLGSMKRVNVDWWAASEYDVITPMVQLAKETGFYLLSPGSTTHMAALVARGEFLASVFPGTEGKNVDIAAAKVIVEAAGGKVTNLFGEDQRYDQSIKGAIVSNGIVHDRIVRALRELKNQEQVNKGEKL